MYLIYTSSKRARPRVGRDNRFRLVILLNSGINIWTAMDRVLYDYEPGLNYFVDKEEGAI